MRPILSFSIVSLPPSSLIARPLAPTRTRTQGPLADSTCSPAGQPTSPRPRASRATRPATRSPTPSSTEPPPPARTATTTTTTTTTGATRTTTLTRPSRPPVARGRAAPRRRRAAAARTARRRGARGESGRIGSCSARTAGGASLFLSQASSRPREPTLTRTLDFSLLQQDRRQEGGRRARRRRVRGHRCVPPLVAAIGHDGGRALDRQEGQAGRPHAEGGLARVRRGRRPRRGRHDSLRRRCALLSLSLSALHL